MTHIQEVTEYSVSVQQGITALLHQLTTSPVAFDETAFRTLLSDAGSHLFVLHQDEQLAGMLTVGVYYSPTGSKAWIEDVVVDDSFRGQGYGRLLVQHAIRFAQAQGVQQLMLTSNPRRVAANKLYQSLGFERKETNMYRMKFSY